MSLLGLFLFIFAVWQMPHRESERCVMILACSRQVLGRNSEKTTQLEASTLYSLAGTVLSLAVTWFFLAHSFVQPIVA